MKDLYDNVTVRIVSLFAIVAVVAIAGAVALLAQPIVIDAKLTSAGLADGVLLDSKTTGIEIGNTSAAISGTVRVRMPVYALSIFYGR